ncbi:hypothetical protein E1B28_008709 [Marasmius oreades]|uniref:Pali-domain-containing protein n=1 Tax=Marasmius oreades TaxID=181124 RepID=A0A9P7RYV8_9AGAR|nr:uncharacterized protein E1B28_008709 [Marasmius oreades]KAG7092349.1 hypothetical protein E1B28_008709 [Marasmius oreades]
MILLLLTPALLFIAFLLLLLISLSVPIIKTIYLFRLATSATSDLLRSGASGAVDFGVWGYCADAIAVSVFGFDRDASAQCSDRHLGYGFDSTVARILRVEDFNDIITKTTTAALVLHPIACGLTFLTLLVSLFMLRRGSNGTSRFPSLLTLGIGILTALLTTIVFLIDVIFVAVIRGRVNDRTDGEVTLGYGNAVWMALGAALAIWLAMVGACGGVCACGSRRFRKSERY